MAKSRRSIDSPFFAPDEAADYLRIAASTLEHYRAHGTGPPYRKHGHRILYHRDELDAWSQGRKYHSTGAVPPQPATQLRAQK